MGRSLIYLRGYALENPHLRVSDKQSAGYLFYFLDQWLIREQESYGQR
jgi:hypothetical protein